MAGQTVLSQFFGLQPSRSDRSDAQVKSPSRTPEVIDLETAPKETTRGSIETNENVSVRSASAFQYTPQTPKATPRVKPVKRARTASVDDEVAPVALKKNKTDKLTPLEQQFVDLKMQHRDSILAIRVGYKYKFFGDDARTVAKLLDIMLLEGKFCADLANAPEEEKKFARFAYCSIPDTRLHIHLKRLLSAGLKVGVVEQTETAALKSNSDSKSKIFERSISRVYTAATYIDDEESGESMLSLDKGGGYIVALTESNSLISVVGVHLLSGDIVYDTFQDGVMHSELETRLFHLYPIEIVVVGAVSSLTTRTLNAFRSHVYKNNNQAQLRLATIEPEKLLVSNFAQLLEKVPNTLDLVQRLESGVKLCCAQLSEYLKDFELESVFEVETNYKNFSNLDKRMILDANTLQNLEIYQNSTDGKEVGSLLYLLNHTRTRFGARLLRKWLFQPLMKLEDIRNRSAAVDDIMRQESRRFVERLGNYLHSVCDLEKGLSKVHYKRTKRKETYIVVKSFVDLIVILTNLGALEQSKFTSRRLYQLLHDAQDLCKNELADFKSMLDMIRSDAAMDDEEAETQKLCYFKYDYFENLKAGSLEIKEVERELEEELRGIRQLLKRPSMTYDSHGGDPYLVSVRNTQVKTLPSDWVKINGTKSISRFKTPTMVKLQKKLQYKKDLLIQDCERCYDEYLEKIDQSFVYLKKLVSTLAELDCLFSLSTVAVGNFGYTKPNFVEEQVISLKKSRNPISEVIHSSKHYIANDVYMGESDSRVLIITGPNMGGKSSFMKQIALTVIMAQIGGFVPAESATLGVFDSVYIRMGAQDEIMRGKSTFEVELSECSTILRQCTDRSLVLLDEVGRGTSATDGLAIAHSILDYLITTEGKRPFMLFITHFPALEYFEDTHYPLVKNAHMDYRVEKQPGSDIQDLVFLYKIAQGVCRESYGLNAARLAKIDESILKKGLEVAVKLRADHLFSWGVSAGQRLQRVVSNGGDSVENLLQFLEL